MIRFFCQVTPGPAGDIGYGYLKAIEQAGAPIRAIPIGPAGFGTERRWWDASRLFQVPMTTPYTNIVCARIGLSLGQRANVAALARDAELPAALREIIGPSSDRVTGREPVFYDPSTAFAGLYTVGTRNVAIVEGAIGVITASEVAHLARYDAIVCASLDLVGSLVSLGLTASFLPPDRITLQHLEALCGSAITATTVTSPVSVVPPATTFSPSITSTASSSRSLSSAINDPLRRSAIQLSTLSLSRTIGSWVSRTWRSITRRLAFWRR